MPADTDATRPAGMLGPPGCAGAQNLAMDDGFVDPPGSRRTPRSRLLAAGIAALAVALAACSPAADGGSTTGTSASPGSSVSVSPAASVPVASVSIASPAIASPSAAAGSPVAERTTVKAYFFRGDRLVPVQRSRPATAAVARAALTELLAGPSPEEAAGPMALVSVIPAGTVLLDVSVGGGIAVVDLTRSFESGGGSASMFGRLAQVVYTLTQFPSVTGVTFRLEGEPVTTFSSEGIVLDRPAVRADYRDYLPAIFVDQPASGATLSNPARVAGMANVFEAQFVAEIAAADGTLLARRSVMATCGTGCWGTFDVTIPYQVDRAQAGWVTVYDLSARDGTRENVSSYPVTLTPAA